MRIGRLEIHRNRWPFIEKTWWRLASPRWWTWKRGRIGEAATDPWILYLFRKLVILWWPHNAKSR